MALRLEVSGVVSCFAMMQHLVKWGRNRCNRILRHGLGCPSTITLYLLTSPIFLERKKSPLSLQSFFSFLHSSYVYTGLWYSAAASLSRNSISWGFLLGFSGVSERCLAGLGWKLLGAAASGAETLLCEENLLSNALAFLWRIKYNWGL